MEQQIKQLYKPLSQYIKKRINNQADAEDLTQEVFYKLSKSDNSKVHSLKSWVYTIAKNTITDYYRKKKVMTIELEEAAFFEEHKENEDILEMSKCIGQFINKLPENYRFIMTLSELKEMPQKEIAAQLNMNYVTVRSKIQRGRKKLKALFSNCCSVIQGGKGSILAIERKNNIGKETACCH